MAELQGSNPSSSSGRIPPGGAPPAGGVPGGGAGAGGAGGSGEDQQAKMAQEDEQRRTVMSQILSSEARERRESLDHLFFVLRYRPAPTQCRGKGRGRSE